jgi:TPR repeat protein
MNVIDRENQYIRKWRLIAIRGDSIAMSNVAAAYRILGDFRLAARWYKKAAEQGDGDAMTDWGYCLQHGVGIRRDERSAERAYRSAIACKWITDFSREEAMYHLAVLLLSRQSATSRRAAKDSCVLPMWTGIILRPRPSCGSLGQETPKTYVFVVAVSDPVLQGDTVPCTGRSACHEARVERVPNNRMI